MSSKKAVVKISSDVAEAKNGIDQVTKELNKLSKNAKESSFSKLAKSAAAVGTSFKLVTDAVKKVNESIKENIDLAQKQEKAELLLATAAKNNPYLTDASVIQLKNYAGELQKISTIGDEELLPMMAQLASAGRTQEEIQNIMQAALDVSASGMMSLDSAVTQLNKTLSGSAGTLGNQISEIKKLTKEELESGKAIDIVAEKFKGMSKEVSEQTGGWEKYKNSVGDLKEILGEGFANIQNTTGNILSDFFDDITNKLTVAKKAAEDFKAELNLITANAGENATVTTIQSEIDLLTKENETYEKYQTILGTSEKKFVEAEKTKQAELQKTYDELLAQQQKYVEENQDMYLGAGELLANAQFLTEEFQKQHPEILKTEAELESQNKAVKNAQKEYKRLKEECYQLGYTYDVLSKRIESNKERIEELTPKLTAATEAEKAEAEAAEKEAAAKQAEADAEAKAKEALEKRDKLRENYDETIRKTQEQINNRRKLGEAITEEQEAQILLNAATQAYINMYSDPVFERSQTKTGVWAGEAEQLEQIEKWQAMISTEEELEETEEEDLWAHEKELVKTWQKQKEETLEQQKKLLQNYLKYLKQKGEITVEQETLLVKAIKNIEEKITEAQAEALQKRKEDVVSTITDIQNYIKDFSGITKDITSLARQNNEQERDEALTSISEQYTDGLISYEEYCEKKKQINKKAAQEEYRLKQWEWTASMLEATANVAQGVAKAIAQGGVAGIITGALVAAAGAVQIATITANKPKPPSFATGGIVQGNSYSGDHVRANVNSGEMILNAQQQANLWRAANSGGGGGVAINMPVKIENHTDSNVNAQMTPDGLIVTITKIVNAQMQKGAFTDSMDVAQGKKAGVSYL